MKSLPLQMQQNLILAATLIAGVVFAPQNIEIPQTGGREKVTKTATVEPAFGTATSFSHRPENTDASRSNSEISTPSLNASGEPNGRGNSAVVHVPSEVQGEWHWAGDDSSSRFRFYPNGRYSYVYSVFQSSRGRRIESTTIEEGAVAFQKDGSFVMKPDHGHFQGNTGDGYINRDMEQGELGERTFHWERRGNAGMFQLLLGPSAKSAHVFTASSVV